MQNVPNKAISTSTRDSIRAMLARMLAAAPTVQLAPVPAAPEPEPEPAPPLCPFCLRVCVGAEHHAFATLHYCDPVEHQRRIAAQSERDEHEYAVRRRYGVVLTREW